MLVESYAREAMSQADVTKLPTLNDLNGPLADRVYRAVKTAIMQLDFPPGAAIRKASICEWLGLSRSPVSEALAKLSTEGLVDIVPQSGTRVARLSMAEIREDAFMREALEVAAARNAAHARAEETVARLSRNLEMQKLLIADGAQADFMETDMAFHEAIMETTGVTRLPSTVNALSQHVNRARRLLLPEPGGLMKSLEEHIQIYDAIRHQDAVAAEAAMRHHVRRLLQRLEPLEAARPDLFST